MMYPREILPLSIALLFSFLLHGTIILFAPGFSLLPLSEEDRPIVVELLPPRPPSPLSPEPTEQLTPALKDQVPPPTENSQMEIPKPPSLEPLYGALERLSVVHNQPAPPLDIHLPQQERENPPSDLVIKEQNRAFVQSLLSKIEQGQLPSGNPQRKESPLGFGRITAPDRPDIPGRPSSAHPPFVPLPPPSPETNRVILQENLQLGIRGPVSERRVIYQPPLPEVRVNVETEIELKFWVLPDGTVGRVIPLRKGDTTLETIAINYLKNWRFEPLTTSGAQEEQWGTIPFKFLLQ